MADPSRRGPNTTEGTIRKFLEGSKKGDERTEIDQRDRFGEKKYRWVVAETLEGVTGFELGIRQ